MKTANRLVSDLRRAIRELSDLQTATELVGMEGPIAAALDKLRTEAIAYRARCVQRIIAAQAVEHRRGGGTWRTVPGGALSSGDEARVRAAMNRLNQTKDDGSPRHSAAVVAFDAFPEPEIAP